MPKLVLKTEAGKGQAYDLKSGRYLFGTSPDNDFQLDHPSVAEHHCEIEVTPEEMIVRDLGSLAGTYVNGKFAEGAKIQSTQTLRIGDLEFSVEGGPARVFVPQTAGPEKLWQVDMPDGYTSCAKHHSERGIVECNKCQRVWCTHCVHRIGLKGKKALRLCPECGSLCGPAKHKVQRVKKGIWARLFDFFFGWMRRKRVKQVETTKPVKPKAKPKPQPPCNLKIKGK